MSDFLLPEHTLNIRIYALFVATVVFYITIHFTVLKPLKAKKEISPYKPMLGFITGGIAAGIFVFIFSPDAEQKDAMEYLTIKCEIPIEVAETYYPKNIDKYNLLRKFNKCPK
jgi:hypothetical protein